jgi:AraC-like DNA-binding protein
MSSSRVSTFNERSYVGYTAIEEPLLQWSRQQGIAIAQLIENTGLSPDAFESSGARMRPTQRLQLLRNLLDNTDVVSPGLQVGALARIEHLGVLGLMMLVAPSVGEALESGAQFASTASLPGQLVFERGSESASIRYTTPSLELPLLRYIVDDCFAAVSNYIRSLLSGYQGTLILAANFNYPAPSDSADHKRYVPAQTLSFGCAAAELELPSTLLRHRPPLANRFAYDQCLTVLENLLRDLRETRLRFDEARALIDAQAGLLRTLDDLVGMMGVSRRSLQRCFADHDTSFSRLLADSRRSLASGLLRNPALSIADVASLVGYGDVPNFRRAFLSWTGVTPAAFRARLLTTD